MRNNGLYRRLPRAKPPQVTVHGLRINPNLLLKFRSNSWAALPQLQLHLAASNRTNVAIIKPLQASYER